MLEDAKAKSANTGRDWSSGLRFLDCYCEERKLRFHGWASAITWSSEHHRTRHIAVA